jgi:hypothetical protein
MRAPQANTRKGASVGDGSVSHRSSRSKSQGVVGCGEAKAEAKASGRIARKAHRLKKRSVTPDRPEADVIYAWADRSPPDGGWRIATDASIFCSGDLRIGVIVQSNSAIAGSPRNVPQDSLAGDGF